MTIFNDQTFFENKHSLTDCINHEYDVFRENQSVLLKNYIKARIEFLQKQKNAELSLEYVKQFSPKVALFAGSFNPFHKGHYNVLQKAEKIFDKVIVAFGQNPDKSERTWEIPNTIKNRQIEHYEGLLTDLVAEMGDVTVIRGLRNSTDFNYEQNQYRYIQELMPNIKIVNIFCDKEFEHISSSGIRTLEKFNKHKDYLLD
ncbi:MAG: adenylyltransferase/cytidyltransferase family protein [Bacteroidetes bacterium]|nr:adenylyltransferase/cytidyltransferase family protein [Bacteroidota bacterium]